MTRKKKIWIVVCSLLVLGSAAAAYLGATSFSRQIDPSLKLNIQNISAPAAVQNDGQALSQQLNAQKAPVPQAGAQTPPEKVLAQNTTALPAEAPAPPKQLIEQPALARQDNKQAAANAASHCGNTGTIIILFLGTDERDEIPYGADFIRFFKVDFSRLTVTCVALSRDLWVKTPALADKHIKEKRLGEVFDVVQTSTKGSLKEQYLAATTVLTQTIFDNFGVVPDLYLTVPQSSFATLVDGLGGIEVDVPQDQDAYKHVLIAGKQNLNGQQALAYIRLFEGYKLGDFGRNSRQLPFIKAVLARIIEPANMVKIPGLVNQLQEKIVTDLSPALIASLTCMLAEVPRANITFHTLTPDMTSPGPEASLLPDAPKIQAWLQGLLKK